MPCVNSTWFCNLIKLSYLLEKTFYCSFICICMSMKFLLNCYSMLTVDVCKDGAMKRGIPHVKSATRSDMISNPCLPSIVFFLNSLQWVLALIICSKFSWMALSLYLLSFFILLYFIPLPNLEIVLLFMFNICEVAAIQSKLYSTTSSVSLWWHSNEFQVVF